MGLLLSCGLALVLGRNARIYAVAIREDMLRRLISLAEIKRVMIRAGI